MYNIIYNLYLLYEPHVHIYNIDSLSKVQSLANRLISYRLAVRGVVQGQAPGVDPVVVRAALDGRYALVGRSAGLAEVLTNLQVDMGI